MEVFKRLIGAENGAPPFAGVSARSAPSHFFARTYTQTHIYTHIHSRGRKSRDFRRVLTRLKASTNRCIYIYICINFNINVYSIYIYILVFANQFCSNQRYEINREKSVFKENGIKIQYKMGKIEWQL